MATRGFGTPFKLNTHTQTCAGLVSTGASVAVLLQSKVVVLNWSTFSSHLNFIKNNCFYFGLWNLH